MDLYKKTVHILGKGRQWGLLGILVLTLIGAGAELLGVSMILPFVNAIMDPEFVSGTPVLREVQEHTGWSSNSMIALIALALVLVYVIKNIYLILMNNQIYKYTYRNQRDLACKMMQYYMGLPYMRLREQNSSDLIRNITADSNRCFVVVLNTLQMTSELLISGVLVVYLIITDPVITFLVVVIMCISMFLVLKFLKSKVARLGVQDRLYEAQMNKCVLEAFGGVKEVKITHSEKFFMDDYYFKSTRYAELHRKCDVLGLIPKQVMEVVTIGSLMLSLSVRLLMGADPSSFVPIVSVFAVAAFRLLPSVNKISGYINSIAFHKASFDAIYGSIDEMRQGNEQYVEDTQNKPEVALEREFCLKGLSFHYPDSDKNVIDNIDLTLSKNESIAFIGPSGAGKTTLADIILGVLTPQAGDMLVDGVRINDNIYNWQKRLGYIPQQIFLFDDNIRRNIAFGIPENEIDDKKVWKALEEAQLKSFVDELPEGLETRIGERGARLSGGQRQRIGIARALYYNPDILVLDEATSALDNETERAVMESIEKLQGSKTMIIIAHRLTTVQTCDNIYEVKDGKVIHKDKREIFGD
jgi:ABC-type multidrug transport system fused ATPase/permease subunit